MIDYFKDNDNKVIEDNDELEEKLKDLEEDQQRDIQKLYDRGEIIDYKSNNNNSNVSNNSNGKTNKKQKQQKLQVKPNPIIISEQEIERNRILNEIQKLRKKNPELTFEQWFNTLKEKRIKIDDKVIEYFPDKLSLAEFELSIKTILNIEDINLPFMGIVFAVPSSLKTAFFEFLRKLPYSYFSDKFTAKSFVSHSAAISKDKLATVDLLPRIKDKIILTPELSPLFTGKDDDIREQFGVITRVIDGKGFESESGVHGQRGYHGSYMFTWLGAAVDIPSNVYKFLSTIGFKIYFLRLPRTEVTEDELVEQLTSSKKFNEKMEEIEKLLMDYLIWFEICPISVDQDNNNQTKIEWSAEKDDKDAIKIIAKLALLLAHIRGHVVVYKNTDYDDRLPIVEKHQQQQHLMEQQGLEQQPQQPNTDKKEIQYSQAFSHGVPIIEHPSRANQQLYNLARGHALSYGRNYITKEDLKLVIKVVLSTASIERVLILDLLIANKGTLTTSQITKSMNISNNTAKYTMTQFKGLELVTMERTTTNTSNSEYKITLNSKFHWFLTEEFANLRYEPAVRKKPLVCEPKEETEAEQQQQQQSEEGKESTTIKAFQLSPKGPFHFSVEEGKRAKEDDTITTSDNTTTETASTSIDGNLDSHRGENSHSKNNTTAEVAYNIQSDSAAGETLPSSSATTAFTAFMPLQQQSMESKIQAGLFTNSLISISDLLTGNYDPEIINNIDRVYPNSDRWFCYNCTLRDDKWGMMKHSCRHNKRKTKKETEV